MQLNHTKINLSYNTNSVQTILLPIGSKILGVSVENNYFIYLHISSPLYVSFEERKFVLYQEDNTIDDYIQIKEFIKIIRMGASFYYLYEIL